MFNNAYRITTMIAVVFTVIFAVVYLSGSSPLNGAWMMMNICTVIMIGSFVKDRNNTENES